MECSPQMDIVDKEGFALIAPSLGNGYFVDSASSIELSTYSKYFSSAMLLLKYETSRLSNGMVVHSQNNQRPPCLKFAFV